jgi:hypothetical protein
VGLLGFLHRFKESGRTGPLQSGAFGLAAALMFCTPLAGHAETSANEYSLKAAFIYNFARFVEWPEGAFKHKGEFCIGSLGRSPLDRELSALSGKSVKGRTVVFRQYNNAEAAAQCQVLFVSRSEPARLVSILDALKDLPVLTVSDQDAFCSYGGTLSLSNEKGKIVFDVNIEEKAQGAKLTPSSQLLKLARKIYGRR